MSISDLGWRQQAARDVEPRLSVAHKDLTVIAGHLRDIGVDVWTESPSDGEKSAGRPHYSLEGWRVHFREERKRFNQFAAAHGAKLAGRDAELGTALDGYVASLSVIVSAMASVMRNYQDGSGNTVQVKVSRTDRDALATAIEAELA